MKLATRPFVVPSHAGGIQENAPVNVFAPGEPAVLEEAQNVFATKTGRVAIRGGSKVKRSFTNQTNCLLVYPFTPVGLVTITYANGLSKYNLQRLTADAEFFTGVEATSTHDLSAAPSTSWNNATLTGRPVAAELFEKLFLADATIDYAARNKFLSIDSAGTITEPSFNLGGGAQALKPYCLEEYNNVLFIAGYDNATANADVPAMVRHSFLGVDPGAAGGFTANSYNTIGAKGQRVTAMRKGKGLLLLAKSNELYRISGPGLAYDSWNYAVDGITNTLGLGASNPHALCFHEGFWYGVGEAGPWRSDGHSVERLGGKDRSWARIANLKNAVVNAHPDRNCIMFALNQTPIPSGRSATYPNLLWTWDVDRERWTGEHQCLADIFYFRAIPTATVQGPTAPPTGLTITHASATLTTIAVSWTNADATASTEVWVRLSGGTWALHATAAPAVNSATISSLTSGREYAVKVRHIKNGIPSDYTAETAAYTLIPAPTLTSPSQGQSHIDLKSVVGTLTGTVVFERDTVEIDSQTITEITNSYSYRDIPIDCGTSYSYRSRVTIAAWPAAVNTSAWTTHTFATPACL